MGFVYQIQEITEDANTGLLVVHVHAWATEQRQVDSPDRPDDSHVHMMQFDRAGTSVRVVTDRDGKLKRLDGVFVAPGDVTDEDEAIGFEKETYTRDYRREIDQNIRRRLRKVFDPAKPDRPTEEIPDRLVGIKDRRHEDILNIRKIAEVAGMVRKKQAGEGGAR